MRKGRFRTFCLGVISSEWVRTCLSLLWKQCDASVPRSDLSLTSDAAGVAARLSEVDPRLPFLEGKKVGVASVLLTSIGALGS